MEDRAADALCGLSHCHERKGRHDETVVAASSIDWQAHTAAMRLLRQRSDEYSWRPWRRAVRNRAQFAWPRARVVVAKTPRLTLISTSQGPNLHGIDFAPIAIDPYTPIERADLFHILAHAPEIALDDIDAPRDRPTALEKIQCKAA